MTDLWNAFAKQNIDDKPPPSAIDRYILAISEYVNPLTEIVREYAKPLTELLAGADDQTKAIGIVISVSLISMTLIWGIPSFGLYYLVGRTSQSAKGGFHGR